MDTENFTAQTTVSKGCEENKNVLHTGIRSLLDGLYMCQNERVNVITSSSSCWRLLSFVISYCCDILEEEDMSGFRYGTMVDRPGIGWLATRELLCN